MSRVLADHAPRTGRLGVVDAARAVVDRRAGAAHAPFDDLPATVGLVFRAMTLEPELLPRLLEADALPDEIKELARRRIDS